MRKVQAGVSFDQVAGGEMIHPGLISGDEHVGGGGRFDLAGEDGGTGERKRHMLAGRRFVVRTDFCQHIGEGGGGENERAALARPRRDDSEKKHRQSDHYVFAPIHRRDRPSAISTVLKNSATLAQTK